MTEQEARQAYLEAKREAERLFIIAEKLKFSVEVGDIFLTLSGENFKVESIVSDKDGTLFAEGVSIVRDRRPVAAVANPGGHWKKMGVDPAYDSKAPPEFLL